MNQINPETSQTHKVSAVYGSQEEAERVRQLLIYGGIAGDQISLLDRIPLPVVEGESDDVLKDILVDGAVGTAVGTGVGAIGTAVLWATSVTLFVASPVVAPLAMLGWFAGIGGIAGAVVGAATDEDKPARMGKFSELVIDAIESGHVVLVVRTYGDADRALAKTIISNSLNGHTEALTESN